MSGTELTHWHRFWGAETSTMKTIRRFVYILLVRSSDHSKVSNPLRTLLAALKILKFRKWSLQSNVFPTKYYYFNCHPNHQMYISIFFPRACPLGYFSLFISRFLCYCIYQLEMGWRRGSGGNCSFRNVFSVHKTIFSFGTVNFGAWCELCFRIFFCRIFNVRSWVRRCVTHKQRN